jgi:hypothetical protein
LPAPIIPFGHLSLPAYKIVAGQQTQTGDASVVYNRNLLVAKSPAWKNFSIKSSDASAVPMLYSAGYCSAFPTLRGFCQVVFTPTVPFGKKATLLRYPRVITHAPNLAPIGSGNDPIQIWANDNATWLNAGNISVVVIANPLEYVLRYPNQDGNWLTQGLPLTGVTNVGGGGGVYAGVVDQTQFIAGQVYEMPCLVTSAFIGDYNISFSPNAFIGDDTLSAADVATNKAIYPRYLKRKVVGFTLSPNDAPASGQCLTYNQGLATQLSSYGFAAITNMGPGNLAALYRTYFDSRVSDIKAFFGVS